MSRYVEIDTALLKTVTAGRLSAKALWRRIMEQPSIDIVRCGECKWRKAKMMPKSVKCLFSGKADDFCSYGCREEE